MNRNYRDLINKITKRIVEGANPEKVILFGSSLKESGGRINDLDFLVIKPSGLRRDERDSEIRKLLPDVVFPMDIFVYTPEEARKYGRQPGSFVKKVMETGEVLYNAG